jgi:formate-dependent nitrite reductase membrane component NrfD
MTDRPIIKPPVWTWEIPVYFYVGGLSGACAGLSLVAEARGERVLARRASDLAFAAALVNPALLISDLGRPERFLHMLRMFKVTSPMSVGSWILAGFSPATGLGWLDHATGGRVPGGRAARTVSAVLGLPLASYTAVLIANTAVPVWHESRRILPFVFVAGAAASAGAGVTALTPHADAAPARRLAVGGAVAEIALTTLMEHRLGSLSDAYRSGPDRWLSRTANGALAAGAVGMAAASRSRAAGLAGAALVTAGALLTRWSIFRAGVRSATTPRHTVETQR